MKLWLSVLVSLLPLGVMAAPAGNGSFSLPELQAQWDALTGTSSLVDQPLSRGLQPFLLVAEGAADEPGKSIGGPDEENGEEGWGDEEKEEKTEEKEGGGGWDRLWDAPKLG
jgi:hypothetical protein